MASGDTAGNWQEYHRSGKLAFSLGDLTDAERSWTLALEEARKIGPEDPRVVRSLLDLATLYDRQTKYPEAEPLIQQALEITEREVGRENPRVAVILNNLGAVYYAQRRHWDAEAAYRRALAILINAYGPFHASVAAAFNNLAELCRVQGRYLQAEPMYRYVLAIYEFLDPNSLSVAAVLNNLVFLLCARGKYFEAQTMLKRALALEKPGANKPFFDGLRSNYALLVKKTGTRSFWHRLTRWFNPEA
jgi:tetratricopeptide (TPR) repeat protein